MNLGELEQSLKSTQAALIVSEENRRYFTGFNASNGYLLVTRDGSTFITDGRYIEDAKRIVKDAEVLLQDHVYNQLNRLMQRYSCNEILVEASRMSILDLNNYRRMLNSYTFNVSSRLDRLISSLREVKLDWEIEQMKRAQAIAEKALLDTLPFLKAGARERDVANELDYRMRKYGADGLSFDTIVVSGDNSSKPHGVPGEKVIEDGDFVTIDYGALYNGYHSDTTRTFAVGSVTEEMANVYNTVLKAQMAGCEALRPGMTAEEYDGVARKIITDAGYGEYFTHSMGHGVGVEIHEPPFCGPRSKGVIQAGNCVSCEPGIYLEGRFGVRIEDMLLVTEDGSYNFCTLPKELQVL